MSAALVTVLVIAAWAAFLWLVYWADARDQKAHDRWMKSPDRIWNQHRSTTSEGTD